jgi:hypothetical protein
LIDQLVTWLIDQGFAEQQRDVEVTGPDSGQVLAVAEAVWPAGLQEGRLGEPIVLELHPDEADEDQLAAQGYLVFTSIPPLRQYAERRRRESAGLPDHAGAIKP